MWLLLKINVKRKFTPVNVLNHIQSLLVCTFIDITAFFFLNKSSWEKYCHHIRRHRWCSFCTSALLHVSHSGELVRRHGSLRHDVINFMDQKKNKIKKRRCASNPLLLLQNIRHPHRQWTACGCYGNNMHWQWTPNPECLTAVTFPRNQFSMN